MLFKTFKQLIVNLQLMIQLLLQFRNSMFLEFKFLLINRLTLFSLLLETLKLLLLQLQLSL